MFTGIVEEVGSIRAITNHNIVIECLTVTEGTKIGDSIAVNGVCLTVSKVDNKSFTADVSPETFRVTALSMLKSGSSVNLERAMPANGRFGGHIVSGHVDNTAKIINISQMGEFYQLAIEVNPKEARYIVKKGSVTINGISLTVADIENNLITIAVIPHTYENTCLKQLNSGDFVNIEVDIISKYVEKFLSTSDNKSRIDMDFLQVNGFC